MRLTLVLIALALPVAAEPPRITGPEQTVFDWQSQRCARWDIPDGSARAWRGADGRVQFLSANEDARLSAGPDLDTLTRDCTIVHAGKHADAPGSFDDRSWLAASYLGRDGRLIALAHVEYQGHRRAGQCDADSYSACWWNTIVELSSEDGTSFRRVAGPKDLVAALPQPYRPDQERRTGYFNPSNIIAWNGYLYALIFAEDAPPQRRGACLIRRPENGRAADWRAWDGADFSVAFADPYRDRIDKPERHVCAPLPGIVSTLSSVVRRGDEFLAVTPATLPGVGGERVPGIWTLTSRDLVNWSEPSLLMAAPLLWRRDCAARSAYAYPSFLDPDSSDPNFATVDDAFWLYLVKIHLGPDCKAGPRRDMIRMPVSWPAPAAAGIAEQDAPQAPWDRPDPRP